MSDLELRTYPLNTLARAPTVLPADHKPWPTLVFLHGNGEAAPKPIEQALTLWGPLRPGNPAIASEKFLVVAPQLPARSKGDHWGSHAGDIQEIVDTIVARGEADPKRLYLTGFSYGANGVFRVVGQQKNRWAAIWPVDPPGMFPSYFGRPIWLWYGSQFWNANETNRATLNLAAVNEDVAKSSALYTANPALAHTPIAVAAYGEARVYEWLLQQILR